MSPSRRVLVLFAALIPVLAIVAASLQRIPPKAVGVGVGAAATAGPGWHWHRPFRPLAVVSARGEIALDDLAVQTAEGSRLVFRLDLDYELGARLAPQFATDLRASGLPGAAGALARRVLEDASRRSDAEGLLSSPALIEAPLKAALEGSGVSVTRLVFRSPLGDELIRRRATDAVAASQRAPLSKVVVIGWDGADWRSILPLVAAGRMPNMAKVLAEGAHGDLRSYDPMFSPLLWTTVATGKAPTEHGIADFLVKDASSDSRHPITSDFRRVKALWNIFSDFNRRSAWVAWWASYPAETIDGVMISDLLSSSVIAKGPAEAARVKRVVTPDGYLTSRETLLVPIRSIARDDIARFFSVSEAEWRDAQVKLAGGEKRSATGGEEKGPEDPVVFVTRMLAAMRTYHNVAKDLIRAGMPFVAVYYEGVDIMGHRFQHYLPPKMNMVSQAEYERFKDAVPRWYEYQDVLLGDLLAAMTPDTTVVILSDHGFLTGADRPEGLLPYTKGQPVEWHRDWGILALRGPVVRKTTLPPSSIYDVAPTLLFLEGLPAADDMPGRVVNSAFHPDLAPRASTSNIKSYEIAGARLERGAAESVDPGAMAEMMANLRALGYVGGEPASPSPPGAGDAHEPTAGDKVETQYFFHRNLAVSHIRQGHYQEAEAELLLANQRKPFGKTYSMLSEVRATQGRFGDAAAALEEGWREVPSSMEPTSLLWIVQLHLLAKDRAGAEEALTRWSPKMTAGARAAAQGRLMDAGGDPAGAAPLYRQALQQDPLLVRIAQRLQELDAAAGRPFELEPFLLETLGAHPKVDAYWDLAGQMALSRGDAPGAAARFRKAVDLQPENGLYLGHLASACATAGREPEAREALAWAERFPPREPDAWMALGAAWDRLGDADRAVRAFDAASKAGLDGPGAEVGAALALARAGRAPEARRRLDQAAIRFPDSPVVAQLRARLGG